jgi:hypothetical protein
LKINFLKNENLIFVFFLKKYLSTFLEIFRMMIVDYIGENSFYFFVRIKK